MERATIDEVTEHSRGESELRALSDVIGSSDVVINHYRIPPGDGTPSGLHAHFDQEEVFLVLAGTATFERLDGTVTVGEREAIRFEPGEFQTCTNRSEQELVVLAFGAPPDSSDVRIPAPCPDCGRSELRLATDDATVIFVCPGCESEHVPVPCPNCGSEDLAMRCVEDGVRAVCAGCREVFERPPMQTG